MISELKSALLEKIGSGNCEFSYMTPEMQQRICLDDNAVKSVRDMNRKLFYKIEKTFGGKEEPVGDFSPARVMDIFNDIIRSAEEIGETDYGFADDTVILRSFIKPEYFRILLRWPCAEVEDG